ncbi:MAG: hypothetical protein IJS60_08930 [Abditibacteriota bacterium]|nr:hypothetical protein [Abditibacteriota bacterium]
MRLYDIFVNEESQLNIDLEDLRKQLREIAQLTTDNEDTFNNLLCQLEEKSFNSAIQLISDLLKNTD